MEKSENVGMQTFDSHLLRLFKEGTITLEEALQNAAASETSETSDKKPK